MALLTCLLGWLQVVLPPTVPASLAYLHVGGAYLLDNGQLLVLWIGREAAAAWLTQVRSAHAGALRLHPQAQRAAWRACPDVSLRVPDAVLQVLGPDAVNPGVDPSTLPLEPARDNALSLRVCSVIMALRGQHVSCFAPAFAVRQGTPLEAHVVPLFVEDRSAGQLGFSDFLQQLHRGVMNK